MKKRNHDAHQRISERPLLSGTRWWLTLLALLAPVIVITLAAVSVPFVYETQTLWYKFGLDRHLLRAGQVIGFIAAILLFLQVILAVRLPVLDHLFGLDKLYHFHRINGVALLALVSVHLSLVLIPEGVNNLPIGWKFWPELVGALAFFTMVTLVPTSYFRPSLKIPYQLWSRLHRIVGFLLLPLVGIHILFVSESFAKGLPRKALLLFLTVIFFILLVRIWQRFGRRKKWRIVSNQPLGGTLNRLELRPLDKARLEYAPGQFAFFSAAVKGISAEPHPFTIASSPSRDDALQIFIKGSGDWTNQVGMLQVDDVIAVEGPYGRFSYTSLQEPGSIILIAGGVGITPMLSMLRHMASNKEKREILLIWSNRTPPDKVFHEEFERLRQKLTNFSLHMILTGKREGGRIDGKMLARLLPDRVGNVFLCGPAPMMVKIRSLLRQQGFENRQIHWERFSL